MSLISPGGFPQGPALHQRGPLPVNRYDALRSILGMAGVPWERDDVPDVGQAGQEE